MNRPTFLLSPANCGGTRGRLLRRPESTIEIAQRLRTADGVPVGDVFAFISGLYFRGKLAYARAFAVAAGASAFVITPSRGLLPIDEPITIDVLEEFAACAIDADNVGYRAPLERDVARLAANADGNGNGNGHGASPHAFVLLGSIASDKYVEVLLSHLGERLLFPETFVGRGDMSRGGVMLRAVSAGEELTYARVAGATRHGPRPPRLERLPVSRLTTAR
jgi:hypothetical protein